MIPDHVITLICVIVALWALFRWGGLFCMLYALWFFWNEQWGFAALAFGFACALQTIRAGVVLLERAQGYRGPWV
ncbi:MAG: hypothetical protein R3C25_10195 [Hyphomonadaceae bacterium]